MHIVFDGGMNMVEHTSHYRQKYLANEIQKKVATVYERFELIVTFLLSGIIALIIVISLVQLIRSTYTMLFLEAFNPLDHVVFQTVFGMIMTLMIAMEFKHSILGAALRRDSIIKVKTVVLIAIIALARKFVILDSNIDPDKVTALAFATVALGAVYWLMREREG